MEYPGSIFTRPWRRLVLFFFTGLFLVLAPGIIFYTAGYRYDWKNGLLRKTGAISIDALPTDAIVTLNGQKIKGGIPVRLTTVAPGRYTVQISAPNYYDWQKEITVTSKQTNYIHNIRLIERTEPILLKPGSIGKLGLSSDGRHLAYVLHHNGQSQIRIWDTVSRTENLAATYTSTTKPFLIWSKQDSYLAMADKESQIHSIRIVKGPAPEQAWNISQPGRIIEKFKWHQGVEPELYFSTTSSLIVANPVTRQESWVTALSALDWLPINNQLWTLQLKAPTSTEMAIIRDASGFSSIFATFDSRGAGSDLARTPDWGFVAVAGNDRALLKKDTLPPQAILFDRPTQHTISGVDHFLLSPFSNLFFGWNKWELWSYGGKGAPRLIDRMNQQLREVAVLDLHNTLVLTTDNQALILFPDYGVYATIPYRIEAIAADALKRVMYFTGTIDGQEGLWQLSY